MRYGGAASPRQWQRGDPDPRSMRVDRGFFCFRGQVRSPVENGSNRMRRRVDQGRHLPTAV